MRITSEAMVMRSLDRLHSRLAQYERAQTELSTGKRILNPSDDPAGTRRVLSLKSALAARQQELTNIDDARGWLDTADTQLQTVTTRLNRVNELVTLASSEQGTDARRAIAEEIRQITDEIAGIANSTHLERPLFGGFGHGAQVQRNADGLWVFPDERQGGAADQVMRRVSDSEQVRINVTAPEWLGSQDIDGPDGTTVQGPWLLNTLDRLVADLQSDTPPDTISGYLNDLKTARTNVGDKLSEIGAATNRVESARARSLDLQLTLRTELSQVENIDMAEGIMQLQLQQVAYEATLQALGRALPPSLVAFLR